MRADAMPAGCAEVPGSDPPAVARFGTTLVGGPSEVREALGTIVGWLETRGVGAGDCGRVELALAEALNNIVEHALAGQQGCGIDVMVARFPHWIDCELRDGGLPMPSGRLPQGRAPDVATRLRDLPEGGFGWFLIRELTANLRYTRECGINHLSFRIDLAG
jgi:serine/threonine-protein kinase RsbW